MHSAEDSAAIAVRILQRRERERAVEAAERNEVASLREYAAALEARLNGLYAEMAQPAVSLRPRGIGRRLLRTLVVALLGAVGVLLFQMKTPLGARLTDSLRRRSVGGLAADVSQAIRRQFSSPTTDAPASQKPAPAPAPIVVPPAPVVVQQPQPQAAQTTVPAPAVASPRSEEIRRRVSSAPARHAQPRKQVQSREPQEAVIPACSDSDPLCGISKRPH